MILECRYPNDIQDQLLKDQYIFGLCVKEIQDHLLGEIVPGDTAEKCLHESRKIEFKIEQCKVLGIKTSMTYDVIFRGRDKSQRNKSRDCPHSNGRMCKYYGKSHNRGNCPTIGKKCQKCGRDNHFKAICKIGNNDKCDSSCLRPKKGKAKGKKIHKVTEEQNNAMDDLADQVQSLFYHDIHSNAINMWMHTRLECETPDGLKTNETFKIDTGADGNFMPITMFVRLFQKISLETLEKIVESRVTLFVYNNTPIKQFGTCSVRISYEGKHIICKFYVVEFNTAIIGISD